jgi:rod shape-determining protein MreD
MGGLTALFLQTTVFSHLPVKPDLVLIIAVCLGLFHPPIGGVLLAFLLGCLMDVFSGSTLGFFALTKTLVFFVAYSTRDRLYFDSPLAKAGLVSIAALIEAFIFLLMLRYTSDFPILPSSMVRLIVGPVLFTTAAAPVCFSALRRFGILALANEGHR